MILAIDSSSGTSVAVVDHSGRTLSECLSADRRAHAELIGVLIQDALERAGITPADVTAVVMGIGPGPFTGLRVGMAAASAFAHARALPLFPVVSHDSVGWTLDEGVVVTDARRGEVAYSVYCRGASERRVNGPALAKPDELEGVLGDYRDYPRHTSEQISAADLARVQIEMARSGAAFPPPSPVYLRAPDVTVKP